MKTLIKMNCPSCDASLEVEKNQKFVFCEYCGTKVIVNDENEYTYRNVDEAAMKRAETERLIQLKEMEMEAKKQNGRKALIIFWAAATVLLLITGIVFTSIDSVNSLSIGLILIMLSMSVALYGAIGLFSNGKGRDKRTSHIQNGIKITSAMADTEEKNYQSVIALYKGAGFHNITCVPMNDLNFLAARKNGQVESLVIDGDEDIRTGDIFSADAPITITYHSRK